MAFSGLNTFILDEWGRGKASNRVRKQSEDNAKKAS